MTKTIWPDTHRFLIENTKNKIRNKHLNLVSNVYLNMPVEELASTLELSYIEMQQGLSLSM